MSGTTRTMVALVAVEARSACSTDASLEANVAAAMNAAAHHWMVLDDDPQFRGACAGLLQHYDGTPEGDRIQRELSDLEKLSAVLIAAQAGLTVGMPEMEEADAYEKVGLLPAFRKAKRP